MAHIIFNDQRIEIEQGQTVLSALLDKGYEIPNSCRAGACQSCMMKALDGEVPERAQSGLKDTLKAQGYFLACSCEPIGPLHVVAAQARDLRYPVTVIEHALLATDILRLRLKPEQDFDYRAGQYITVWKTDTTGRSYSLASVMQLDDDLELHIRRITDGMVSNWLHDEIQVGDTLQIQAATGDCFYIDGTPDQKILLAGTGTGLAPLIGIARDALRQKHSSDIHLVHGARQLEDLYMHQPLIDMSEQYANFHYHANVLQGENITPPVSSIPLEQQIMDVMTKPAEWRVYLCGDADIVNKLKKKLFLAGASMNNIYTDPFIVSTDV